MPLPVSSSPEVLPFPIGREVQTAHTRLIPLLPINSQQVCFSPTMLSLRVQESIHSLEKSSTQAYKFLTFLCALDYDDIPEALFCRIWCPREQWSAEGEIECKSISVVDPFVDLLTNASLFHSNIRTLESSGLIESMPGPLKLRKFYVEPLVRKFINMRRPNPDQLGWIQLNLICHAFPGRPEENGLVSLTHEN
jgi:hypothetical protein